MASTRRLGAAHGGPKDARAHVRELHARKHETPPGHALGRNHRPAENIANPRRKVATRITELPPGTLT